MAKIRRVWTSKPQTTPASDDFAGFRASIMKGAGRSRGLSVETRLDALQGLEEMLTRCPHVLVLCAEQDDVLSLVSYHRSRRVPQV